MGRRLGDPFRVEGLVCPVSGGITRQSGFNPRLHSGIPSGCSEELPHAPTLENRWPLQARRAKGSRPGASPLRRMRPPVGHLGPSDAPWQGRGNAPANAPLPPTLTGRKIAMGDGFPVSLRDTGDVPVIRANRPAVCQSEARPQTRWFRFSVRFSVGLRPRLARARQTDLDAASCCPMDHHRRNESDRWSASRRVRTIKTDRRLTGREA